MTAWKDFERRICRALGGQRAGARGHQGSDGTGTSFAVECKRTTRYSLRRAWIDQARRQGKAEGLPWLLVISEHNDRRPIVTLDFWVFAELAQKAGAIPEPLLIKASGEEQE